MECSFYLLPLPGRVGLAQREEERSHMVKGEQQPKNEIEYTHQRAMADKEQKDKQLTVRAIELQRMCLLDTMVTIADARLIVDALCGTNELQSGTTLATWGHSGLSTIVNKRLGDGKPPVRAGSPIAVV